MIEGMPLSVNQTYKTRRASRAMYLSDKARSYSDSARWQAKAQWIGKKLLRDDLEVFYFYYFGDYRIHDHLNYNKALSDSLNQIVWQDDRQIKVSHHYTRYDKQKPRVEIVIRRLS